MTRSEWLSSAARDLFSALSELYSGRLADGIGVIKRSDDATGGRGAIAEPFLQENAPDLQDCRTEATLLLREILHLDKVQLLLHAHEPLTDTEYILLKNVLARRKQGEPLAYILGVKEFYGLDFQVDSSTLIPRPETEFLVEEALQFAPADSSLRILDLGTGSGCIPLAILHERPQWQALAIDISTDALAVACRNAQALQLSARISFLAADFSQQSFSEEIVKNGACPPDLFDIITANPPYINPAHYVQLSPDVRSFEPETALICAGNGLSLPLAALHAAEKLLKPGGLFLMEHGYDQAEALRGSCSASVWHLVRTGKDYAEQDRYLYAIRSSAFSD